MGIWVRRVWPAVTILTALPLLWATDSYGQSCTSASLRQAVEQLQDRQKRPNAQTILIQCGEVSVNPLAESLSHQNAGMRRNAAETLGQLGWDAKAAVPSLRSVAARDADTQVRDRAITSLDQIIRASEADINQLQGWQVREIEQLKSLKQLLDELWAELDKGKTDWPTKAQDLNTLQLLSRFLDTRLSQFTEQPSYRAVSWGQSNPWIVLIGLGGVVIVTAYGTVFWLRPLWLLKFGDELIQAIAKLPQLGTALSGVLKVLLPLKYHPRVLDAWVEQHWQQVQAAFLKLDTVKDRHIHIPLPVRLDGTLLNQLSSSHLSPIFQHKTAVLLITGEGGAGKTSLTCQIAGMGLEKQLMTHRLLPVLIETELDDKKTLTEAIGGQLNASINQQDNIPPELLQKLLHHQRILVIIDHLSEMSETTRKQVTPDLANFPAKALIVTSRLNESLGGAAKTVLEPLQIETNRLWKFIPDYLESIKKRDLFEDDEYSNACDRLRSIAGERPITVLLARLYIDHLIQEREGAGGILPDSVPKLMLSYLNRLNQNIDPAQKRDDLDVQRDAQIVAWECLKQTYRPTSVKKVAAIAALATAVKKDAKDRLDYLEQRLQVLQSPEPKDKTRIILDPLAEYLAATYRVEHNCCQENPELAWREFFQEIDQKLDQSHETSDVIRGFLLAVWDCCEDKAKETRIPDFVTTELDPKAGVNRKELERVQENRRVRKLISELSAPEPEYRIRAAQDLGQRGSAARIAAPNLIGMLENRNQALEARQAAAQTLGKLGIGAERLLDLLTDETKEKEETAKTNKLALRRSAAESLGLMKAGQTELRQLLDADDQPLPIRQGAARALGLIGAASGEAVPMLMVELQEGEESAQVLSIPVWREPLTDDLTLDLVTIPGGEFLMGSPVDEVGRDWYQYSFPELKDVDVEAQHCVTVPSFSMSQYPITQVQWRFVAALPAIDQELELDPASFKGDRRPIETVSWKAAVEFCARLSQYTGKTYHLPSEAEWEYACRANTTSPFHVGDTLSTEVANYDGNYTYGDGAKGEYRQKTTEVGSFGIVNAFGLSDMHGNVWEWCLDHWHPSYEGAPSNGSVWITDGDERYRLLRGGSWYGGPRNCRSANRDPGPPDYQYYFIGFRVVCVSSWTL